MLCDQRLDERRPLELSERLGHQIDLVTDGGNRAQHRVVVQDVGRLSNGQEDAQTTNYLR